MAQPRALGVGEFVALAASMMALLALSIDMMLPSLAQIGHDLGAGTANHRQYVVSFLILGMSIGQVFYGPLSEGLGRKPALSLGLTIFALGCIVSVAADDFREMLLGRFLQGLGAAGPRIVTIALIRDQFVGSEMARIMSFVIATLMVGPLLAPFLGQAILVVAPWRFVFLLLLAFDLAILVWLVARQPETLPKARRMSLAPHAVRSAVREVVRSRAALGYSMAAGVVFGELFAYVASAQQIFQDQYGVGAWFPFCLSVTGAAIAVASLVNARFVATLGMRPSCARAAWGKTVFAGILLLAACRYGGRPPLGVALALFAGIFFCAGILFGNLNALAMECLGHVAGVAAGVVGSLSWFVAVLLSTAIGQRLDGTVAPLAAGLVILSLTLLAVMRWTEGTDEFVVGYS